MIIVAIYSTLYARLASLPAMSAEEVQSSPKAGEGGVPSGYYLRPFVPSLQLDNLTCGFSCRCASNWFRRGWICFEERRAAKTRGECGHFCDCQKSWLNDGWICWGKDELCDTTVDVYDAAGALVTFAQGSFSADELIVRLAQESGCGITLLAGVAELKGSNPWDRDKLKYAFDTDCITVIRVERPPVVNFSEGKGKGRRVLRRFTCRKCNTHPITYDNDTPRCRCGYW